MVELPTWLRLGGFFARPSIVLHESVLPAPPLVPTPRRPHVGSDALRLADLAFTRGDAVDAAAQYRALLAHVAPEAVSYVELQLARAYLALQRPEDAEPLLQHVASSTSTAAWPALLELATVLVRDRRRDPVEVLRDLEPGAGAHSLDLLAHLLYLVSDDDVTRLFVSAPRGVDPALSCVFELSAFERNSPGGLPGWHLCPREEASQPAPTLWPTNDQLIDLELVIRDFNRRLETAHGWLEVAHDAAAAAAVTPREPIAEVASWIALAAIYNAAVAAAATGERIAMPRERRDELLDRLRSVHRPHAERLLATFLRAPVPQP